MHGWIVHHYLVLLAVGLLCVAALVAGLVRRWWVLVPLPLLLALAAWYGWEFSGEGFPLAVAIAVLGYAGLAVGAVVRRWAR